MGGCQPWPATGCRRNRTGFEETKDFPIRINDLIAGRYQVDGGAPAHCAHRLPFSGAPATCAWTPPVHGPHPATCAWTPPWRCLPRQVVEFLGSAAFSRAVQALDLKTGMLVCLKIIKVQGGVCHHHFGGNTVLGRTMQVAGRGETVSH